MPELPEVETTRRGIAPHIVGQPIKEVIIRHHGLRWPVPADLPQCLTGQTIEVVRRRGKYLLMQTQAGTLIAHLGMSGSLRMTPADEAPRKHDHVDIVLAQNQCLRFHDPRRFGALLWTEAPPEQHPLISKLGPEPLSEQFDGGVLFASTRHRKAPIKTVLMDASVVVGVGNIYANEALFLAGIHPKRGAHRIARGRYDRLAEQVKQTLQAAINQGGTTLRDFVNGQGQPGYFQQTLNVYGRQQMPCPHCSAPIQMIQLGQRATYFCKRCQT